MENAIVERGNDGKYSVFMDCYDYDFSLAGFGSSIKEEITDFYACVEEEKAMHRKEGKTMPELEFDIQYDIDSFRLSTKINNTFYSFANELSQLKYS